MPVWIVAKQMSGLNKDIIMGDISTATKHHVRHSTPKQSRLSALWLQMTTLLFLSGFCVCIYMSQHTHLLPFRDISVLS